MKFKQAFIWLIGIVFITYGLSFAFFPASMSNLVTDSAPGSVSGLGDMRATYGGMSLAVGLLMIILARKLETVKIGLISVLIVMLGMAGGRILGIAIDGAPNILMYIYLAAEILTVLLAAWALRNNNGSVLVSEQR